MSEVHFTEGKKKPHEDFGVANVHMDVYVTYKTWLLLEHLFAQVSSPNDTRAKLDHFLYTRTPHSSSAGPGINIATTRLTFGPVKLDERRGLRAVHRQPGARKARMRGGVSGMEVGWTACRELRVVQMCGEKIIVARPCGALAPCPNVDLISQSIGGKQGIKECVEMPTSLTCGAADEIEMYR